MLQEKRNLYINNKISYMKLAQIGFLFNLAEPAYSKNIVAELGKLIYENLIF